MWKLIITFLITLSVVNFSCRSMHNISSVYFIIDNKVFYYRSGEIDSADPESFLTISRSYDTCGNLDYAKDEKSVYYGGKKIIGADPKTFEVISGNYYKDKEYIYYKEKRLMESDAGKEIKTVERTLDTIFCDSWGLSQCIINNKKKFYKNRQIKNWKEIQKKKLWEYYD